MAKNFFGITDTGKQRTNNEDAFIAAKLSGQFITACVIDGLGGYEGGEVAAALAKDAIIKTLSSPSANIRQQLTQALVVANNSIQEEKKRNSAVNHMACVVTLALVDNNSNKFYYAHVGDTRLYLLRDSSLVKITSDQSFVGFLEDNGRISEEEAMTHPKRNEINKALGFDAVMDTADYFETGESPFLPGDTIMLCSDGLSDMISSNLMKAILNSNSTIEQKARELIDAANEAGGNDNITVVLVYNDKKQSRPTLGRSVVQKKTQELIDEPLLTGEENVEFSTSATKSNNTLVAILSAALVLAIAAIGWLLFKGKNNTTEQILIPTPLVIQKRNNAEKALADSLQSSTIHEISVEQKATDPAIIISDTIFINRDSLLLHGNGLTFRADSAYNGPVFVLGDECRYILFDSIRFENFSTAIITKQNNLHLKEVRFINCVLPIVHPVKMQDSAAINGSMINYQFKQDSTHYNQR
jgi:serine/threonine protein phosphatase PrpC